MNYLLFDDTFRTKLLPFTYTRPICDLRVGIFTFRERWERLLEQQRIVCRSFGYLFETGHEDIPEGEYIWLNSRLAATADLIKQIKDLPPDHYMVAGDHIVAARFHTNKLTADFDGIVSVDLMETLGLNAEKVEEPALMVSDKVDFFQKNASFIHFDFELAVNDAPGQKLDDDQAKVYGRDNLYVAPGASLKGALIDAENGPVYIGPEATVQFGAIIQGTHAFGKNSVVAMGAKLRGDSAFGPYVKVGGEVGNSVIMGFGSKVHDGYLGNSVLGYWCNLGADTNTSNLKNNYDEVRLWDYEVERFTKTGTIFCGLMMGDHSKAGINSMFNTGTVVGVGCNIYGAGYPRNFIPSFSWGGAHGLVTHRLDKMLKTAGIVMGRRSRHLTDAQVNVLKAVFELTSKFRKGA